MPAVVVTGARQGIGAAIAEAFAEAFGAGAQVALVARSEGKLEAVAERCRAHGATAEPFPCDVTDDAAVAAMAAAVQERFGVPDVLVNNAGLFQPGGLLDLDPAAFREQVEVNLTSAYLVTRAFLPALLERGAGDLFFMASVAALRGYPGGAAYCAGKHGLLGLARVVREETKAHGLRVTALLPGATFTPSWEGTELPEERFMPPEDVARAVVDLHRLSGRTVAEEVLLRPQHGDV
ncbi:MAG: SDR family oxidoreductase [Rhodothermales bacterium]|nr:SDR family oxidoreductase [Rhodothermales bacterium]